MLAGRYALLSTALGVLVLACGSLPIAGAPPYDGVYWTCSGKVELFDDTGRVIASGELKTPNYRAIQECELDALGSKQAVLDKCKADCEDTWTALNSYWPGSPPTTFSSFTCQIDDASVNVPKKNCERGSVIFYNGGPAFAVVGIDPASSSADLTIGSQHVHTQVSGTVDLSIGAEACVGTDCPFLLSSLQLTTPSFSIGGHSLGNVTIQNRGLVRGSWNPNGTFAIPMNQLRVTTNFDLDGSQGVLSLSNVAQVLRGNIASDYDGFRLSADFTTSSGVLHLELTGHAIQHPPTTQLTPNGTIECNDANGAQITFSAAGTTDPENDIVTYSWAIDNALVLGHTTQLSTNLALGSHLVQVGAVDRRGGVDVASNHLEVVDTSPPTVSTTAMPSCLFPPNHKMVLFEVGNGLDVVAQDTCTAAPSVRIVNVTSNQPALGSGSGHTNPDLRFGDRALCIRGERTGTETTDREYTVFLEVKDASGNTTASQVKIVVPHDLSDVDPRQCNMPRQRLVEDDDPRCAASSAAAGASGGAPGGSATSSSSGSAPGELTGCTMTRSTASPSVACWTILGGLLACLALRRQRGRLTRTLQVLLVLAVALVSACSGGSISASPLSGTIQGMPFMVTGSRATWNSDRTTLTLVMTNYVQDCGSLLVTPMKGQTFLEAVVLVPVAQVQAGTYTTDGDPVFGKLGVSLSLNRSTGRTDGSIDNSSVGISNGVLRIDSATGPINGGLSASLNDTNVSGTFSVPVCPQ